MEEEATTASNVSASAIAQTTGATSLLPPQSGTGTNSPGMQFYPPPLAPSSRRCHPPANKFQDFFGFPCVDHYQLVTLRSTLKS